MFRMSMAAKMAPRHPVTVDCPPGPPRATASVGDVMTTSCFSSLLVDGAVLTDVAATTKDAVLRELAGRLAVLHGLDAAVLLDGLRARESLGSTGVGCGVAIPHVRSAVAAPVGVLLRLARPVDFDSVDAAPVDLVLGMVTPASCGQENLQALACAARTLRDPVLTAALRAAAGPQAMADLAASALRANGA